MKDELALLPMVCLQRCMVWRPTDHASLLALVSGCCKGPSNYLLNCIPLISAAQDQFFSAGSLVNECKESLSEDSLTATTLLVEMKWGEDVLARTEGLALPSESTAEGDESLDTATTQARGLNVKFQLDKSGVSPEVVSAVL